MRPECIKAVSAVLGRDARPSELAEIESRLSNEIQRMARQDREAILSMTPAERVLKAAEKAAAELVADAELKAQRKIYQVEAQAKLRTYVDTDQANALDKIKDILDFSPKGSGRLSIFSQAREIGNMAFGNMLDTLQATNPKILGLFEDQKGTLDLIKELHGEDSGNPLAKQGAKAFHDTSESLRQRFNRGGGDIGKLESYDMPHHHSHALIVRAGRDAWVKDIMPLLNRDKYVKDDGALMNDTELKSFLDEAYVTISTDGANKREAGTAKVGGSRANRGNAHRQIHFAGADAHVKYWEKYGEQPLFGVLQGHIKGIANDIALVETMGPNADHGFKELLDYAATKQKMADPAKAQGVDGRAKGLETLYRYVSGTNAGAANHAVANTMRGIRSIQTGAKLGSAIISSITDQATMFNTALFNNLKYKNVLAKEMELLRKPEMREAARRAGLGLEATLSGLDRWGTEGLGDSIGVAGKFANASQKLTGAVMRASGLSQITDIRRQAFSLEMMDVIGSLTRKGFDQIDESDRVRLEKMGVTAEDWAIWQKADTTDIRGNGDTVLTPADIYRIDDALLGADAAKLKDMAATKLAGVVGDEARMAIIEPSAKERAWMYGDSQAGTVQGELARSFWQFKSFGIAMAMKHISRGMAQPTGTAKAAYLSRHIVGTTLLGGVAVLIGDLLAGKDPRDITTPAFFGAAFTKGGALGIYGDFLYGGKTKYGDTLSSVMLGPTGSLVLQPLSIAAEAVTDMKDGKPADVGGKVVQYVKGNTPGASLWYIKSAMDHLIWQDAMEFASPGYLQRMKRRAQKDTGQQYWWEPGENLPERAPDLAAMGGE
jgi:hypothetical protein